MNHVSGFNALPNELYHLIASYTFFVGTLCALTQVSKRSYEAFNPIVYRKIDTTALFTVASAENSRLPLNGPHPATFVRSMVFDLPFQCDDPGFLTRPGLYLRGEKAKKKRLYALAPTDPTTFQKLVEAAVKNVVFYAPHAAVKSFEYRCDFLSLPEAFRNIDFSIWSSLESLVIACPFPTPNLRKSLAITEALCGPSLKHFSLILHETNPVLPSTAAKILQLVQRTSPNVSRLCLNIPDVAWEKPKTFIKPFQKLLNDPEFFFPCLTQISLADVRETPATVMADYEVFIRRHSEIKDFSYVGMPPDYRSTPFSLDALPKLSQLATDVFDLLGRPPRSASCCVESLVVTVADDLDAGEEEDLKEALSSCTKTLRRLCIYDLRAHINERITIGIDLGHLRSIVAECPHLTHFQCALEVSASELSVLPRVYGILASNLPDLEHLKLSVYMENPLTLAGELEQNFVALVNVGNEHYRNLENGMRNHRAFKTAQVQLFSVSRIHNVHPELEARWYFVKEGGKLLFSQKPDRPEFGMELLIPWTMTIQHGSVVGTWL